MTIHAWGSSRSSSSVSLTLLNHFAVLGGAGKCQNNRQVNFKIIGHILNNQQILVYFFKASAVRASFVLKIMIFFQDNWRLHNQNNLLKNFKPPQACVREAFGMTTNFLLAKLFELTHFSIISYFGAILKISKFVCFLVVKVVHLSCLYCEPSWHIHYPARNTQMFSIEMWIVCLL